MNTLSDLILPRLPHRPYCTNNLDHGLFVQPANIAITKSHLQLNPVSLRHWFVYDIDTPLAALVWERANLPPPNWIAVNPSNAHAHYGYLLELPLVTSFAGHDKPLRYAAAIEAAYRLRLHADPGYVGLVSKNPLNEQWKTWYLHDHAYGFDELAEWVSLPKNGAKTERVTGLGRNVTLFDSIRQWAYSTVRSYKAAAANLDLWHRAILHEAEGFNSRFANPLSFSEVRAVAKSVANWSWRKFSIAAFSELQSERAQRRWNKPRPLSTEQREPWREMGISRRTYYTRKKAGLIVTASCTDAISDNNGGGA